MHTTLRFIAGIFAGAVIGHVGMLAPSPYNLLAILLGLAVWFGIWYVWYKKYPV